MMTKQKISSCLPPAERPLARGLKPYQIGEKFMMANEIQQPPDGEGIHYAIHYRRREDCQECTIPVVEGQSDAPLEMLGTLAAVAEFLQTCEPDEPEYQKWHHELISVALAFGKAMGDWEGRWADGAHDCEGEVCDMCAYLVEPPDWDPAELECAIHPNCKIRTYHPRLGEADLDRCHQLHGAAGTGTPRPPHNPP